MKAACYFSFNGNCAEAMTFYEKCLGGGTLNIRLNSDLPAGTDVAPEMRDKVMHAHLEVDGVVFMASDIPGAQYTTPTPMVQVHIEAGTDVRAEAIFAALAEGAVVFMPIQQTFWSSRFGMLRDKFGVPWMISSGKSPS